LLVQRAHDRYSFSHLTLHEYLAACHYNKTGRSQEVANKKMVEQRWREVLLLLAGLQEPDADHFLLGMTIATLERVTSQPLRELLSWIGRIVSVGSSPQQTAARRALILGYAIALILALARVRALDFDRALAQSSVFEHAVEFNNALARARDFDQTRVHAQTLALNLEHAIDRARAIDFTIARSFDRARADSRPRGRALDIARALDYARSMDQTLDHALDRAFALSSMIVEHTMVTAERSPAFTDACRNLEDFKNGVASAGVFAQGLENTIEVIAAALDLPLLARRFTASDTTQCSEFLTCTLRILECRDAAERVTQAGWDRVCEQLVVLPGKATSGSRDKEKRVRKRRRSS
jgi:hypothetical protein